jgi:hypothetical protein
MPQRIAAFSVIRGRVNACNGITGTTGSQSRIVTGALQIVECQRISLTGVQDATMTAQSSERVRDLS